MFDLDDGAPLSNRMFEAMATGFWQPSQPDQLAEFVPRYFADAPAVTERRGPAIAELAGTAAFPGYAADHATIELAQACLRRDDLVPALARSLADSCDDLRRAVAVRDAWVWPVQSL